MNILNDIDDGYKDNTGGLNSSREEKLKKIMELT